MIDKIKELENLENKYKEIGKINSEIESIIANVKNEIGISREKELLEENERLAKDLKAFYEKIKISEEEITKLKNSNAIWDNCDLSSLAGKQFNCAGRKIFTCVYSRFDDNIFFICALLLDKTKKLQDRS